jgi:ComF family protein
MFSAFFDAIFPPRPTEKALQSLTLQDLASAALYDGTLPYQEPFVKALVWEIKYYANSKALALAGKHLADTLLGVAGEELGKPLLIPVPMFEKRRRERGHNQTEVLCEAALSALGKDGSDYFDYEPRLLVRYRHTKPQQGLERHERLTNVEHCMKIKDPAAVRGRVCVVVDDVSTTGATLTEARRALREGGARIVHCISLARS